MEKKTVLTLMLSALLMSMPIAMKAADKVNILVVQTKSGDHQFVLSQDKPQVSFEGTSLKVTCDKASASATFQLADVVRFVYKNADPSGIDELANPDAGLSYEDGTLVISQIKAGETVSIYSTDGRLQQQLKATHSGTYRLSLASLPFGVYLVKTGTLTYKITKR